MEAPAPQGHSRLELLPSDLKLIMIKHMIATASSKQQALKAVYNFVIGDRNFRNNNAHITFKTLIEDHLGWHWNNEIPLSLVSLNSKSPLLKPLIPTHDDTIRTPELLNQSHYFLQFCQLLENKTKPLPENVLSSIDLHHKYRHQPGYLYRTTLLFEAVDKNHLLGVRQLLELGCDTEHKSWGATALQIACERGYKEIVESMLAAGVPLNTRRQPSLQTALHSAAQGGHKDIVDMLIRAGADTTMQDCHGYTAAQYMRSRRPI